MRNLISKFLISLVVLTIGCSKSSDEEPEAPEYIIVNNGGGVSNANDGSDDDPLEIVQAVPSEDGETYSNNIPIILFFNDKIVLNTLIDNFIIKQNNKVVGGTITVNAGNNGFAILTFIPEKKFSDNATITILIKDDVEDDGGNGLFNDFSISFETDDASNGNFDSNQNFESGNGGTYFIGDGAVLSSGTGCAAAQNGSKYAAITSGSQLVSSESSIGEASSVLILGPINDDLSGFSFYYNFISAEFNDYVNSTFDDTVIITVYGPNGAYSEFLTSVNHVGFNNSSCTGFAGMPDGGDGYTGHTGWQLKSLNFDNVGSPAFVIFTVTDVSDASLSSIFTIDNTSF